MGRVMAKVDAWMEQRQEIANELRAAADKIMSGESPFPRRRGAVSAKAGAPAGKRRRRRKMSAAARKRISEAVKARWAKQKAAAKQLPARRGKAGDVGKS